MYRLPYLCLLSISNDITDNHKPDPSDDSTTAFLKSTSKSDTKYNLTLTDDSEKYSYEGIRTSADGQYVLVFDPAKKHFVLHRVDSTFNMNLVSAPWNSDVRDEYSQIEHPEPKPAAPQRKGSKGGKKAATTKASSAKSNIPKQKVEKAKKAAKAAPPPREPTPEPEEDSDDGLTIEYPDAPGSSQPNAYREYNSTPVIPTTFDESDEDEDAEGEEYEDERERNQDVDHLKLPSPAGNMGGMSDEDIEDELEAELEKALDANESDESEEE